MATGSICIGCGNMKYTCEICGSSFSSVDECAKHEEECRNHYQKALYVRDVFNEVLNVAKVQNIRFGFKVAVAEGKDEWFDVAEASFFQKSNTVQIGVKPKEKPKEEKAKDEGTKKKA